VDIPHEAAVVGAGSVGVGWTIVFTAAGLTVRLWDPDPSRRRDAKRELAARLAQLERFELLPEPATEIAHRVTVHDTLAEAVQTAGYVQECAPEDLELKRELFTELDLRSPPDTILASSSSAFPPSRFAADLSGRNRCLVAHPGNPPYLLPIVELVPAGFTDPAVVERSAALLTMAGMSPVEINHEPVGFVFNRLQGAVLREAYCLVRDGVIGVDDLDRVVRNGLGRRWAVIGPFETADLNTRGGIEAHAEKMGPSYAQMGAERGQDDPWTPELVAKVAAERPALLPGEQWEERVAWRDERLMELERARHRSGDAAERKR